MSQDAADATLPDGSEIPTEAPDGDRRPLGALAALLAFLIYLVASLATWGGSAITKLSTYYVPRQDSADSDFFRWAIAWLPYAARHGQYPLATDVLFAPERVNLTWATMVPGPSFVMWPVTAMFGSLAAFNVMVLLAPALNGWAAYLVCRRLTGRFWASLAGGFFFGFSAYVARHMNHPNLILAFPIPIAVYLVIRRLEGSLSRTTFIALLTLTMAGLISISTELFATATMFGGLALAIAFIASWRDRRALWSVTLQIGIAYVIVGVVVLLPLLLPALASLPGRPMHDPEHRYNDLLRIILPGDRRLIGGAWLRDLSARHTDLSRDMTAFLGVGILALLGGFAVTERRRRSTWALLAFVAIGVILTLGPALWIAGERTIPLPGAFLWRLPVVQQALPGRFILYVDLAIAVIAALWLMAARGRTAWIRWIVVVVAAAMLIPWVESPPWHVPDATPAFFVDGTYRAHIAQGETVLVLPQKTSQDMAWLADTDFWFRIPAAYVGSAHPRDPMIAALRRPREAQPSGDHVRAWLDEHGTTAVVVDGTTDRYDAVLQEAGLEPVYEGGGVTLWRSP